MDNIITKKDVENAVLLTEEELENLNFDELCLYLGLLDKMEEVLEGGE